MNAEAVWSDWRAKHELAAPVLGPVGVGLACRIVNVRMKEKRA